MTTDADDWSPGRKKILCVCGTRPEAIKMAPVIQALRQETWAVTRVVATAQHRAMLDQVFSLFGLRPDIDLDVMTVNQSLTSLTSRLLLELGNVLVAERPDVVIAQGDTTTAMTTAMAAFYNRIPFGHVEAGLRTGDIQNPFPEEANRLIAGHLATWHFAPTAEAEAHLLREGKAARDILVSGNTVIDALLNVAARPVSLPFDIREDARVVLITAHRRENFGEPFANVCAAIRALSMANPAVQFVYPVHPNPNVREPAYRLLSGLSNVHLCEPLDYAAFVGAMKRAYFILTDSGGVQEEAPALGKPVLVLRDETERPEAIALGAVKLVGTDTQRIVKESQRLLDDAGAYAVMQIGKSPYGDGQAASRIVGFLRDRLQVDATVPA